MILKIFSIIVCFLCYLYTAYIVCNLAYFLSNQDQKALVHIETDKSTILSTLWSLLVDTSLLSIFMLQHTLMKHEVVNNICDKLHIDHLNRSIYNAASAATLHLLMNKWEPVYSLVWNINTTDYNVLGLVFTIFHVLAWLTIYTGCLMMDILELTGLKQVYYKISGRPYPMVMKSKSLLRYYSHMRHPSFIGFVIILWVHPFMIVDRLFLASILTLYMLLMWNIDEEDYNYHYSCVRVKLKELS